MFFKKKDKETEGVKTFKTEIGGRELVVETGKLAPQTNGSCTVRYGDTVVLATACMSDNIREGIDWFPLMVDFDEKLYAAGKIKGSRFMKREGRASDEAVLAGRLTDRSIRPLFDEGIKNDVQVVLSTLSFDNENDPDVVALNAASFALSISDIPWNGPVAAVRVGRIESSKEEGKYEWVLNPTYEARQKSDLDLVVAGTREEIVMIEAGANEVSEEDFEEAIYFGMKHLKKLIDLMEEMRNKVGKEKMNLVEEMTEEEKQEYQLVKEKVSAVIHQEEANIFGAKTKEVYKNNVKALKEKVEDTLKEDSDVSKELRTKGMKLVDEFLDEHARKMILERGKRVDGRGLNDIRPLSSEVGILPRTHGTGLFKRGETQVMSVVTLGSPSDEQTLDTMEESGKKRYMHHYNFPGFSVGEVKPMRGPGRREIGHGALAEKALLPVLPDKEKFPYTIRVVSEVFSSNGSSSQASACGSSLALMDAGVPIKNPVAGIAMGMMSDPEDRKNYKILTDIQGIEDHAGDMDFKVAGTKDGITAVQLDIKLGGIPKSSVPETLSGAKKARLEILDVMTKAIPEPRAELSPYAPRIHTININPEKIRDLIGPGGKMINQIIDLTGVAIDIEDDGTVFITSPSGEAFDKALELVEAVTAEVEVGKIYQGKVTRLMDFGAFVEVLPGQEGLVHVSEMAPFRVDKPSDAVAVGDIVPTKVKEIDDQGRTNLTFIGTDFDFSKIKKSAGPSGGGRSSGHRPHHSRSGGYDNHRGPRR